MAKLKPIRRVDISDAKFPAELLNVGGVIGDLTKLIVDTAISPQPVLALGAAVCLVGTLAGRKYRTRSNIRTNVYAIGIADSGGGKDYARSVIKDALYAAGLKDYMGGGKIASGSGLLTSLERHPCRLFLLDEMGKFIKSVTGERVGAHREEIWTNLTELYTSSGSVYLGSEYSDQKLRPRVDIVQPCCSIYGVTVPGPLWAALGGSDLSDGSLARFLIFLTDKNYPDRQDDVEVGVIPDAIIAGIRAIVAGVEDGGNSDLPPRPDVLPDPFIVPETDGAATLRRELTTRQLGWLRLKEGTNDTAIVARFAENVGKVALIRAISDCPAKPVITEENVEWATKLVEHCINILLREAGRHVADNPYAATENRILECVRQNGGSATAEQLGQAVRMKAKDREEVLAGLLSSNRLLMRFRDAGNNKRTKFYALPTVH